MPSTPNTSSNSPARVTEEVTGMFDRIAHRYDFLNHFLSGGLDCLWRRRLAKAAAAGGPGQIIDVGAGSGDQAIALARHNPGAVITAVDLSKGLLAVAAGKIARRGLSERISLLTADAQELPLPTGKADAVSMSFLIRNLPDPERGLAEARRVLRPGGRLFVLEFGLPASVCIRLPYLFYLRHLLPRIGRILSGDSTAYRYLNQTIETFPCGQSFLDMMRRAGFIETRCRRLTLGVVYLYEGRK